MNTMREFLDHPQLAARDRWREVESPVGPLRALVPPIALDGPEPAMGPIPALGEHTDAILQELGLRRGDDCADGGERGDRVNDERLERLDDRTFTPPTSLRRSAIPRP